MAKKEEEDEIDGDRRPESSDTKLLSALPARTLHLRFSSKQDPGMASSWTSHPLCPGRHFLGVLIFHLDSIHLSVVTR